MNCLCEECCIWKSCVSLHTVEAWHYRTALFFTLSSNFASLSFSQSTIVFAPITVVNSVEEKYSCLIKDFKATVTC